MKHLKYYIITLFTAAFVACSDDEAMNSASTTVSFEDTELSYNENFGVVTAPLKIEGERNGLIKVNFKVEGISGAIENEHYIVTSKSIIIPADGEGTFACELHLLDDGVTENDDRLVTIAIESVEGATVGANSTCDITIKDVDKIPYYKLLGDYIFTAVDATNGESVSFAVNLSDGTSQAEKIENSEKRYNVTGFDNSISSQLGGTETWTIEYNKAAQTLSLVKGDYFAENINFGSFKADIAIIPMNFSAAPISTLDATWSEGYDVITFNPDGGLAGIGLYDHTTKEYQGFYTVYGDIVMEKK